MKFYVMANFDRVDCFGNEYFNHVIFQSDQEFMEDPMGGSHYVAEFDTMEQAEEYISKLD